MKQAFINWCRKRTQRPCDKVILKADGSKYLLRWHVIPRNRLANIYWHEFLASDEDRAEHDHPWLFNISIYVAGNYKEIRCGALTLRLAGEWKFRWGKSRHRVELFNSPRGELPVTTIFITGPVIREWGFYCPKGWIHWKIFTSLSDDGKISNISRGCE